MSIARSAKMKIASIENIWACILITVLLATLTIVHLISKQERIIEAIESQAKSKPHPRQVQTQTLDQVALEIYKAKVSRDGYGESQRHIEGAYILAKQFIEHEVK